MENKKQCFESIFILNANLSNNELEKLQDELENKIKASGANITLKINHNIRPLVYSINGHIKGYCIEYDFCFDNTTLEEAISKKGTLNIFFKNHKNIIKHIIIKEVIEMEKSNLNITYNLIKKYFKEFECSLTMADLEVQNMNRCLLNSAIRNYIDNGGKRNISMYSKYYV